MNRHVSPGQCALLVGRARVWTPWRVATWDQVWMRSPPPVTRGRRLGDWDFYPPDPARLRTELADRGLEMVGGFVPVALADPDALARAIATGVTTAHLLAETGGEQALLVLADDNGTVAARTQNAGRVTPEMGLNHAQWATFARGAEEIAQRCARRDRAQDGVPPPLRRLCRDARRDRAADALHRSGAPRAVPGHRSLPVRGRRSARLLASLRPAHLARALERHRSADRGAGQRREGWDYFQAVAHGVFCELGKGAVPFGSVIERPRVAWAMTAGWLWSRMYCRPWALPGTARSETATI